MADANIGITETTATSEAKVSRLVQSYLIQESMLLNKISDYSNLATKGTASIKLPRLGGFSVNDKSENSATARQDLAFAADTISLNKHKYVQFVVEDFAELEATVNAGNEMLMRAVKDVALQMDKDIIVALKAASSSSPDNKIVYVDTTYDVISRADILAGRSLLVAQNINPRECYIAVSPEKEAELLNISDFIDASKFGNSEPIQAGVIGKIYGMIVLVHSGLTANETLMWHPTAVGVAIAQSPRVQTQYDLAELGMRYSVDTVYGVATLDSGKRNVEITETA